MSRFIGVTVLGLGLALGPCATANAASPTTGQVRIAAQASGSGLDSIGDLFASMAGGVGDLNSSLPSLTGGNPVNALLQNPASAISGILPNGILGG